MEERNGKVYCGKCGSFCGLVLSGQRYPEPPECAEDECPAAAELRMLAGWSTTRHAERCGVNDAPASDAGPSWENAVRVVEEG